MKYFEVGLRVDWQQFADFSGNLWQFRTGVSGLRMKAVDSCNISKSIPNCNVHIPCGSKQQRRGLGGLEVACWPLVPKFAGSNPANDVGFFRAKKSSARLPSEGI